MESAQGFKHDLCHNSENNKNTEKKNTLNQEGHKKRLWD